MTHGEYLDTIELAYRVKKTYGINAYFLFKKMCMIAACKAGTTDTPSFDAITDNDSVRINVKNRDGVWCNMFINEVPKDMLEFIHNKVYSH